MNDVPTSPAATSPPASRVKRMLAFTQWLVSVLLVVGTLAWLLKGSHSSGEHHVRSVAAPGPVIATGSNEIAVDMRAAIGKKIEVVTIQTQTVTEPMLQVTGSIIACRRPGRKGSDDYWQFSSTDLLNTYTDHEKAIADVDFTVTQLEQIKLLARTKEESQQREIERSEKLVKSGSEAARDLAIQKTQLLETQISNQKDIYQAETAIKTARRSLTAFTIQLKQAGLDPAMLQDATPDMDIVAAEVPEGRIGLVSIGQGCTARFFGLPQSNFTGKVVALSPVLSSEHRTLRVLFLLHDPHDELRPGMFAEIGIGSDPRSVVRISADSVIHVGATDYVLVALPESGDSPKSDSNRIRFTGRPITLSESSSDRVEVVKGLSPGERIAAGSVILLKPALAEALRLRSTRTVAVGSQGTEQ